MKLSKAVSRQAIRPQRWRRTILGNDRKLANLVERVGTLDYIRERSIFRV